jgi:predicted AAA+ superfamily ATPase
MSRRIDPLHDYVGEDFVDRERELESLWKWARWIPQGYEDSIAMLGRRRVGKTAILVRFFNRLFWEQEELIPVYYSLAKYEGKAGTEAELTMPGFARETMKALAQCYLAFKRREPALVTRDREVPELLPLAREMHETELVEYLERHLSYVKHADDCTGVVSQALGSFHNLAEYTDTRLLVIIDEFQVLTDVACPWENWRHNITGFFQWPAQSRWAPLLVSGSSPSLMRRHAFGGLLQGRFRSRHVFPLPEPHAVDLVLKIARRRGLPVREEAVQALVRRTGGHPYYLSCLLSSEAVTALESLEQVEDLFLHELGNPTGDLRQFLSQEVEKYKQLNTTGIVAQVLYWTTRYPDRQIREEKIAKEIGVEVPEVKEALQRLAEIDLVEPQVFTYKGLADPLIRDYIKLHYKGEVLQQGEDRVLKDWQRELRRYRGQVNNFIGEVAEVYMQGVMREFDGRTVEATEYFGLEGLRVLPEFAAVERRGGIVVQGSTIEVDLLGREKEGKRGWFVQSRYQTKPVSRPEVERFLVQAEAVQRKEKWTDLTLWFMAKRGFAETARQLMRREGVLHSDIQAFNRLARLFGFTGLPEQQ